VKPIKVQKRPYTLLLIIALALLLALLAFLQYQWLGRISAGERQIMQTNLRTRANALREEITSEVDLSRLIGRRNSPSFAAGSAAAKDSLTAILGECSAP